MNIDHDDGMGDGISNRLMNHIGSILYTMAGTLTYSDGEKRTFREGVLAKSPDEAIEQAEGILAGYAEKGYLCDVKRLVYTLRDPNNETIRMVND